MLSALLHITQLTKRKNSQYVVLITLELLINQKTWNNNLPYYAVFEIKEKAVFYKIGQKFKFKTFSQKSFHKRTGKPSRARI